MLNLGLQCKGDGEKASYRDKTTNEWCECECSEDCEYRGNECKLTGKLDFIIKDLDIGGIWRLQTRSYNTINNIFRVLNYLKCMNHDIKKSYFRLIVEENVMNVSGEIKKFITLNLKEIIDKEQFLNNIETEQEDIQTPKLEKNTKPKKSNKKKDAIKNFQEDSKEQENLEKEEESSETSLTVNEYEKCLSLVELQDINIKDKVFKKGIFCNMKDEMVELIIHDDILEEVYTWEIGSAIVPITILEKGNFKTLKAYKDLGIIKKQKVG